MVIGQSNKIIGKPIRIGKLEVAQYDIPNRMYWDNAFYACEDLGDGWRLPTKNELNLMYLNKDKIGGFAKDYYWSSSEYSSGQFWKQNFDHGYQSNGYTNYVNVRAVRSF